MVEVILVSAVVSTVLSLLLTPAAMRLAILFGAVDKPDERKIHKTPMPRMGGLAPFVSFVVCLYVLHFLLPGRYLDSFVSGTGWLMITISLAAIVILGICDDIWMLKPGQKFLVQFIAGALVYLAGFRINSITNPFSGDVVYFGLLSFPLTVIWVVGITNAFNLIDGLDGLASGIALIAGLTISAIALLKGDIATALIGVVLSGAVLGFLRYNFNPAKVFLGDSGSLFLGFTLAVLSIRSSTKGSTAFSVIVPLLALGVPVMDTSLAMMRRILKSFLPEQSLPASTLRKLHSMFLPDRRHIHHQLLARGLSHRDAVLVLYFVSCAFGVCAFLVTAGSLSTSLILAGVGCVALLAVRKLGYREMALLKNGILLRLYRRAFVKHALPQVFLDTLSVFVAFGLAYVLTYHADASFFAWRAVATTLITVSVIQLTSFFLGGLYKRTITLLGLGDMVQIMKSTFIGAAALTFAMLYFHVVHGDSSVGIFILLDSYFLATFIVGSRVAFHAMNYIFRREAISGRRALIYGADGKGLITLQTLLASTSSGNWNDSPVTPVGFLDDDPRMEGKFLNGYPIFGGHWKLEGLVNRMGIDEIVVANADLNTAAFERVKKIADDHHLPITISQTRLEPLRGYGQLTRNARANRSNGHGFTPKTA